MANELIHEDGQQLDSPHVLPVKFYLVIWFFLLILTLITVGVSYFDFGGFNLLIALSVAFLKGSFVVLYFMHLRYDHKIFSVVFGSSLLFLALFFYFVFADIHTRGTLDNKQGVFINHHSFDASLIDKDLNQKHH